jgi:hypothetical protein
MLSWRGMLSTLGRLHPTETPARDVRLVADRLTAN